MLRSSMLLLTIAAPSALAQESEPAPEREVVYKDVTEVDFVEARVDGTIDRPGIGLVDDRGAMRRESLLRLRDGFREEIRASVDAVK